MEGTDFISHPMGGQNLASLETSVRIELGSDFFAVHAHCGPIAEHELVE